MTDDKGYLALCYHYVRSPEANRSFPHLLGLSGEDLMRHIDALESHYHILSRYEALLYSRGNITFEEKPGLLITFDDGLSDHFYAAKLLFDRGIQAMFFIPTCILSEGIPANPIIIHYCLAKYRIKGFIRLYDEAIKALGIDEDIYAIRYPPQSDVWTIIRAIKQMINYRLHHELARRVLIYIYQSSLLKDDPSALSHMHLTADQIKNMHDMGHEIGAHSHTHLSIGSASLRAGEFARELIMPRRILADLCDIDTHILSYPFGGERDCLAASNLIEQTKAYDLAYTVKEIVNLTTTPPLELGRHMPMSNDTPERLIESLKKIESTSFQ
jgi:peptidoglycan/xylan/chitin deacetylase (PgdA/CDA1 family)